MKAKTMRDPKLEKLFTPPAGYKFKKYGSRMNYIYRISESKKDICIQVMEVQTRKVETKYCESDMSLKVFLGNLGHNTVV